MTLTKAFLHNKVKCSEISKSRLIFGLISGLLFAFAFYSLLYLTREFFRIRSVTDTYDLWILTDKEVDFYNLFFAFISVIIAQSVVFTYWLDRPKTIFGKQIRRKTSIINDLSVLNWSFLSWFSKLAVIFGITFGLAYQGGFYAFSFYPDYNYLFILIIIVLFLQTWNTINLTFKRKALKWMLYSAIIVSIISFGLSKINLIDYKSINHLFLQKNIHYNYRLELPETIGFEKLSRLSMIKNIYIAETKKQPHGTQPVILVENQEIPLEQLHEKIIQWQSTTDEVDLPYVIYQFHIHKTIKMKFINQLRSELSKSNVSKIAYAVIPIHPKYDRRYYKNFVIRHYLPNWNSGWFNIKEIYQGLNKFDNIIEIRQTKTGACYINDTLTEPWQIKQTVKKLIRQNPNYIVKFYINDTIDFSAYLNVLSSMKKAISDLRNEYAQKTYSKQLDSLDDEEKNKVQQKYPSRILELTTELINQIF